MAHDLKVAARQAHDYLLTLLLLMERRPPELNGLVDYRSELYLTGNILAALAATLSTDAQEAECWHEKARQHSKRVHQLEGDGA